MDQNLILYDVFTVGLLGPSSSEYYLRNKFFLHVWIRIFLDDDYVILFLVMDKLPITTHLYIM